MENEILNNEVIETVATEAAKAVTKKPNAKAGATILVLLGAVLGWGGKTLCDKTVVPKIKKARMKKQAKKDRNATVDAEAEIVEDLEEE